jgi:hypothetical protein
MSDSKQGPPTGTSVAEEVTKSDRTKDGTLTEATTKVPHSVQMSQILTEINSVGVQLQKKKGFSLGMWTDPAIKHDCSGKQTITRDSSNHHLGLPKNDKEPRKLEAVTSFR